MDAALAQKIIIWSIIEKLEWWYRVKVNVSIAVKKNSLFRNPNDSSGENHKISLIHAFGGVADPKEGCGETDAVRSVRDDR